MWAQPQIARGQIEKQRLFQSARKQIRHALRKANERQTPFIGFDISGRQKPCRRSHSPNYGASPMNAKITTVAFLAMFAFAGAAAAQDKMSTDSMKSDAMKADHMKGDAMKGDAMKTDHMKGDAMKGDSMKSDSMKSGK
jgi:pentapeptide MXKDX repeat protein